MVSNSEFEDRSREMESAIAQAEKAIVSVRFIRFFCLLRSHHPILNKFFVIAPTLSTVPGKGPIAPHPKLFFNFVPGWLLLLKKMLQFRHV